MNWNTFFLGFFAGVVGTVCFVLIVTFWPVKKTREEKGWEKFNERKDKK